MRYIFILLIVLLNPLPLWADTPALSAPVVVAGTVPDESTHAKLLARVRELYGATNVVDQMVIGKVAMPPNWADHMSRLLDPELKQVSRGQLKVEGNMISIRGEVPNESQRQQIASDMATRLNPTYTIRNGLQVAVKDQGVIDNALANRNIEFQTGSANLTPDSKNILNTLAAAMNQLQGKHVDITGYTDDHGLRASNISLSQARAEAVKSYLISQNVQAQRINTYGMGPDRPIAPNDTAEGRARNRRIEFRVVQ